ncbi:hypothetical protein MFUR16E_04505 [Methylobacterium fujisawaense]
MPSNPPVAPALRPLLQSVVDSIDTLGRITAAAYWRGVSQEIFAAIADGTFDQPAAQRALGTLGLTDDDLDRLAFWLLASAGQIEAGEVPAIPKPEVTIRLVRAAESGKLVTQSFETADPIAALTARGFTCAKPRSPSALRPELRDAPTIRGFAGPMWDHCAIRYEDARANAGLGL